MQPADILQSLNRRYAVKKFDPTKKVTEEDLATLQEVLRLTPSSSGLQPWKFLIISNPIVKEKLSPHAHHQAQIVTCSHLIVLCGLKTIDDAYIDLYVQEALAQGGDPERLEKFAQARKKGMASMRESGKMSSFIHNQVYIALGNLLQACAHLRIDACPMGGFDPQGFDTELQLDQEGIESVVICPIGYRAQDDANASLKKMRFPLDTVIRTID